MNQAKIGKFIAELRKEKGLTQEQLAEKLGVTSKSISRWENGKTMPDLSLMKPLCNELEITINDLLSGEKIEKPNYQAKFEENILNTINYTDKKINKIKLIFKVVIVCILLLVIIVATMFALGMNRIRNNKQVIFSTWGYSYAPVIDLHEEKIEIAIKEYLTNKSDNEPKHHESEKGFISFKTYLLEEKDRNKKYNIYAWVVEQKYYLENDEIKKDSGSSIPYKFIVEYVNDEYVVTDSRTPRDGSLYVKDMKNIFPRSVRNDMNKVQNDGTIKRLNLEIEQQVNLYFHK